MGLGEKVLQKIKRVFFKSTDGLTLTGEINRARGPIRGTAILAHPHPLYGGNMHNNVIDSLWRHLAIKGFSTFRFDFRGVGNSEGNFEEGIGETRDLNGALRFLKDSGYIHLPCFLIGYSFGAYVIHLLHTLHPSIKGIFMISPPVSMMRFDLTRFGSCPCLIAAGNHDPFCRIDDLKKVLDPSPGNITLNIIPNADHFWVGREKCLVEKFANWAEPLLLKKSGST